MPVAAQAQQAPAQCAAGAERRHVWQRAHACPDSGHPARRYCRVLPQRDLDGIGSCYGGVRLAACPRTGFRRSGFQKFPDIGLNKSGGAAQPPAASAAGRICRTRGIDDEPAHACRAPAPERALAHRFGAGEYRQSVYPVNLPLGLIGGIESPGSAACPGACFLAHAPGPSSCDHRAKSPLGHGRWRGLAHADRRGHAGAKPARSPAAGAKPRAIRALRFANVHTTARRRSTLALPDIGDAAVGGVPIARQSETLRREHAMEINTRDNTATGSATRLSTGQGEKGKEAWTRK